MTSKVIDGLQPENLWVRFNEISQVPRPSKGEEQIRAYLRNFAAVRNLKMKEDKVGNIVINLEPTKGCESTPTIVLQSHVDMVCEKNKDKIHDFNNDPITLLREGDWIKADGTTLGADNGIGVAAALAIATDYTLNHGPIELLFTVDEETGLTGANNLEKGYIKGKYLLNLDTEEDGAFYVGCSGGLDTAGIFKIEWAKLNQGFIPLLLSIGGLKGGHSGIDIVEKRGNAIKFLCYLLNDLKQIDFQLGSITGGSKRNAIPREAEALIFVKPEDESKVRELINGFSLASVIEYKGVDDGIKITLESKEPDDSQKVFDKKFADGIINSLLALPHGAIAMSADIKGLVETSTNLATVTMNDDEIIIGTSQRSSIESAKRNIAASVKAVFDLAGAEVKNSDGYPGWQPNMDSKLLKIAKQVYQKTFNNEPEMKAVHAGLECGILGDKYPGLEMISFGPTITGAHSPEERVNIRAVGNFYVLLKAIIEEISIMK